jgi:site-specific recombinase XerD
LAVPSPPVDLVDVLAAIPEENLWLEGQQSAHTRAAYRNDVAGFLTFLGIQSPDELRRVDRGAVIAWRRELEASSKSSTIRRKLAALSSLFTHLVDQQLLPHNPCRDIKRPRINRREGRTAAFSVAQARALLDAPPANTLLGLRDRAILSVGLQAGARRSAIARLRVGDFFQDRGYDALRFVWKGGQEHALSLHPQTVQRIRQYLVAAGHRADREGPLFRPVRGSDVEGRERRFLNAGEIARIVKKWLAAAGIRGEYSAHSMRATFISRALENGASLEEVQRAAGHADASTTKLYDRRRFTPDKSAASFASY